MKITGAFGNGYKGAQSALKVTFVLGSASMALVQGLTYVVLGQDSTFTPLFMYRPNLWPLNTLLKSNYLPILVLGHGDPDH